MCISLIITLLEGVLSLDISRESFHTAKKKTEKTAKLCSLMFYLEMTTREVHGKDERGEQIIWQLVAWRHRQVLEADGRVSREWWQVFFFFFILLTSSLLTVKFISSCETAISVLTVTVDLCMPRGRLFYSAQLSCFFSPCNNAEPPRTEALKGKKCPAHMLFLYFFYHSLKPQ